MDPAATSQLQSGVNAAAGTDAQGAADEAAEFQRILEQVGAAGLQVALDELIQAANDEN